MGEHKKRRANNQERKRDAVRLVVEGGRGVREVCRELGLHENVLHRRKNEHLADQENAFPGKGHMKPHEEVLMRLKKKVLDLEQEREILKKRWPSSPNTPDEMSLHWAGRFRVLGGNQSGYYTYLRLEENERLVTKIREIWKARRRVYGSPRITAGLRSEGHRYGKNRIARLMRKNGIQSLMKSPFKMRTRPDHRLPVAEDLVGLNSTTASINELWVSDITYVWTWEGWLYLAAVMDVHNREIVEWALRDRLTKGLVAESLQKRLRTRTPQAGLIFHSARGGQYVSAEVRTMLRMWHVRQSMSGRGSCFDNAVMESFFSSLKREFVHLETFHTKAQARQSVFEYIEIFYNQQRRHSSLNHKTPLEYYREVTQA